MGQIVVAVFVLKFIQVISFDFIDYDSHAFSAIGHQILNGKKLYQDLWDAKPPGVYLLNALAFRVFGAETIAIRILQIVFAGAMVFVTYSIAQKIIRHTAFAIFTSALCASVLYFSELFQGGNFTEEYANVFYWTGAVFSVLSVGVRRKDYLIYSGIAFAVSAFFKEPYFLSVIPWLVFVVLCSEPKNRRRKFVKLSIGLFIPFLAFALAFALEGGLLSYWKHLVYNFAYSGAENISTWTKIENAVVNYFSLFGSIHTALPYIPVIGVLGFFNRQSRMRFLTLILILVLLSNMYIISLSGYIFRHYYLQVVPTVFFLCLVGLATIWEMSLNSISKLRFGKSIVSCLFVGMGIWGLLSENAFLKTEDPKKIEAFRSALVVKVAQRQFKVDRTLYVDDIAYGRLYVRTGSYTNSYIPIPFFSFFMVNDKYGAERKEKYVNSLIDQPPNVIVTSKRRGMLNNHPPLSTWFEENYEEFKQIEGRDSLKVFVYRGVGGT